MDELVLDFATGGMNSAVNPASIEKQAVVRMTNCRIENQCPTTRYGIRFHQLDGEAEDFRSSPCKGRPSTIPATVNRSSGLALTVTQSWWRLEGTSCKSMWTTLSRWRW
jgi:hypothetical protein